MLFLGAGLKFVQGKIRIGDGQTLLCNLSAPAPGIHAQAVDVVSEALLLVAEVFSLLFEVSSSLAGVAQRHALFGYLLLREEQFGRARRLMSRATNIQTALAIHQCMKISRTAVGVRRPALGSPGPENAPNIRSSKW